MTIYMRKTLFLILALVSLGLLTACNLPWKSAENVKVLTFYYTDGGDVQSDAYSEALLVFTPDYALRTLGVKYSSSHPKKKVQLPGDSYAGSGVVGGEFFDRFEEITGKVDDGEILDSDAKCVGGYTLKIVLQEQAGKLKNLRIPNCLGKEDQAAELKPLYDDVVALLLKDVD